MNGVNRYRGIVYRCVLLAAVAVAAGCGPDPKDRFGRTYYIDGAGNWGFGVAEMQEGLRAAGYKGSIRTWPWSVTFNPALDQTLRVIPEGRGADLGHEITAYKKDYPDAAVNIIALSAGTGVAVWACEAVTPPAKVHNVILLGSSISSKYNMHKAMRNIDGKVYVYYSRSDPILDGPVRTLGTIDGTFDDPAGLVGLKASPDLRDRIVNIPWSYKYERYGWTGSHTDCTSEPFVRAILSKHIVEPIRTPATRAVASAH
jgi:hypothetical protein